MSSWFSKLTYPIRPRTVGLIVVIGAVSVAALSWPRDSLYGAMWPLLSWENLSRGARDDVVVLSVLGTVVGAWCGSVHGRMSVVAGPMSVRGASDLVGRPLTVLAASVVLAGCLGLLPLTAVTAQQSVVGAPDFTALVAAAVSWALWPSLGWLLGVVVPGRWGVVLSIPLSIAAHVVPGNLSSSSSGIPAGSVMSIAPWWGLDIPDLGWEHVVSVSAARACLFLLGVFAMAALSGAAVRPGGARPGLARVSLITLAPVVLVGGALVAKQPALVVPSRDASLVTCADIGPHWSACVHGNADRLLPDLRATAQRVSRIAPPSDDRRVLIGWGVLPEQLPEGIHSEIRDVLPSLSNSADSFPLLVAETVAGEATGWSACVDKVDRIAPGSDTPLVLAESVEVQRELARSLALRSMGASDTTAFGAMDDARLAAAIEQHRSTVDSCSLAWSDLVPS